MSFLLYNCFIFLFFSNGAQLFSLQIPSPAAIAQAPAAPGAAPKQVVPAAEAKAAMQPKEITPKQPAPVVAAKVPPAPSAAPAVAKVVAKTVAVPVAKAQPAPAKVAVAKSVVAPVAPKIIETNLGGRSMSLYRVAIANNAANPFDLRALSIACKTKAGVAITIEYSFNPVVTVAPKSSYFVNKLVVPLAAGVPEGISLVGIEAIHLMNGDISLQSNPWLAGGTGASKIYITQKNGTWIIDQRATREDIKRLNTQGTSLATIAQIEGITTNKSSAGRVTSVTNAAVDMVAKQAAKGTI